jgi:septum formation protein
MLPLILASSSITRQELLRRLQLPFQQYSPDIDESQLNNEKPADLAVRLAKTKAEVAAKQFPQAIIISADQVIMCENDRLDKPGNVENAIQQLTLVSGKKIDSYTGLCVLNSHTGKYQAGLETYEVTFRQLTPSIIKNYIERDQPFHCAGSIKAEGIGITLFTRMSGRDPSSLLGLPLMLLTDMLNKERIFIL